MKTLLKTTERNFQKKNIQNLRRGPGRIRRKKEMEAYQQLYCGVCQSFLRMGNDDSLCLVCGESRICDACVSTANDGGSLVMCATCISSQESLFDSQSGGGPPCDLCHTPQKACQYCEQMFCEECAGHCPNRQCISETQWEKISLSCSGQHMLPDLKSSSSSLKSSSSNLKTSGSLENCSTINKSLKNSSSNLRCSSSTLKSSGNCIQNLSSSADLKAMEASDSLDKSQERYACEHPDCLRTGCVHAVWKEKVAFFCRDHIVWSPCAFCTLSPFPTREAGFIVGRKSNKYNACASCFLRMRTALECILLRMRAATPTYIPKDVIRLVVTLLTVGTLQ
jgi:hypothetical protein